MDVDISKEIGKLKIQTNQMIHDKCVWGINYMLDTRNEYVVNEKIFMNKAGSLYCELLGWAKKTNFSLSKPNVLNYPETIYPNTNHFIKDINNLGNKFSFEKVTESIKSFAENIKKFPKVVPIDRDYYITQHEGYFYYENIPLNLELKAKYFHFFDSLYFLAKHGGVVKYSDLLREYNSRYKNDLKNTDYVRRDIRRSLTTKSNGFLRASKINNLLPSGKFLLSSKNSKNAITFNNKK